MIISAARFLAAAFGPIHRALPRGNTAPLNGQGILNLANLGTTPVRVLRGAGEQKALRCKLVVMSGANVAWATTPRDAPAAETPTTMTAAGAGAATEGSLIPGGNGIREDFTISDLSDLWIVSSAANTVINLTVVEA